MKTNLCPKTLEGRLAAYMAAAGAAAASSTAHAVVVGNATVQPFGVNGEVNVDFNSDGQTDFQIDHDRVNLQSVGDLDYLQIDKNDFNGQANPLDFDPIAGGKAATFPPGMTTPNDANQAKYVIGTNQSGSYPAALTENTLIGPLSNLDWQESNNFQSSGKWIRANRLIDEDATQIDQILGGRPASGVQVPFNGPNFVGLAGEVRYIGLQMDLNNANGTDVAGLYNYGWVGVRIDNEADATGAVVGYAYETLPGVPIRAGNVPEPGTLLMGAAGAVAMIAAGAVKRLRKTRR